MKDAMLLFYASLSDVTILRKSEITVRDITGIYPMTFFFLSMSEVMIIPMRGFAAFGASGAF